MPAFPVNGGSFLFPQGFSTPEYGPNGPIASNRAPVRQPTGGILQIPSNQPPLAPRRPAAPQTSGLPGNVSPAVAAKAANLPGGQVQPAAIVPQSLSSLTAGSPRGGFGASFTGGPNPFHLFTGTPEGLGQAEARAQATADEALAILGRLGLTSNAVRRPV